MTTSEAGTLGEGTVAEPPALVWAPGPGHAYPATAGGVPLSAFAFAFAVGFLGLVETGILSSAANDIFLAACFGIGAVGLFIGGMWEYRGGEMFGGTFGVAVTGALLTVIGTSKINEGLPHVPAATRSTLASALGAGATPHGDVSAHVVAVTRDAFVSALGVGLTIGAGVTLIGALVALALIRRRPADQPAVVQPSAEVAEHAAEPELTLV